VRIVKATAPSEQLTFVKINFVIRVFLFSVIFIRINYFA
jgi:hypothetical protein